MASKWSALQAELFLGFEKFEDVASSYIKVFARYLQPQRCNGPCTNKMVFIIGSNLS